MKPFRIVALGLLLGAGCTTAQRPFGFLAQIHDRPVDTVARTLAQLGQPPVSSDASTGIVFTAWQNTGFMYGQVGDVTATIIRRYMAVVVMTEAGTSVTLRAETQRCAAGVQVTDSAVSGACEAMEGLVSPHQSDLDALGAKLQQALGHP